MVENFLTSEQLVATTEVFDAMISQWGKSCRLVYPPKYVECTNCSLGHYKTGGPMPFNFGVCPLCNSNGTKATEVSENITMIINWMPSPFKYPLANINIRTPSAKIESKGFIADLPKILQCDHMIILNVDGYQHFKFELEGEPGDRGSIVQGKYFTVLWNRV